MTDRVKKFLNKAGEVCEAVLSVLVLVSIIIGIIGIIPQFSQFWQNRQDTESMKQMLSSIMIVVVGTEFLKMLVDPTLSSVTEVLIFLIARHMVVMDTSPAEDLLSVISIGILFVLRYALLKRGKEVREEEQKEKPDGDLKKK